ncbi:transcription termination factor 1-like [Clupea harengus]|uniref:Transcription termination factor 1-like n=1 Tax=Clupea harengus TaxID=7950 RepID=A0A6P8GSZ1_CLUHA|nr:transcription termination factor 1-like [Clupea harengus]XP_042566065.1 transcription termination factor 1-like [Clupea harengus]
MTEAELVFHKKKKNKTKKQLLEAVPEPGKPPETTTTGVDSHKKHKHKKKKTKSEKDDCRPEGQCDTREGQLKKKMKHDAENVSVTQEAADAAAPQEREVKKKKKKRRIEEPDRPGENSEAEAALTAVQTNLEPVPQKRVKRKVKVRKTHTQPAADTHSPTDARLHPDDVPKAPVLDIDDAIRQEILEFMPRFTFCNTVDVKNVIRYDLPRFRVYKKQGIPLRTGWLTAAENKQLKQNVKDFLAVSGIDSEFKLFRPQRFPDEMVTIRRLKRKFNFLRSLCAGIPRSWISILKRARNFCNRENYLGRFTEDENKVLKNLYVLHGSNWTTISDKMGRSGAAVRNRFCQMSEVYGPWSEGEFKVLLTCLHQQLLKRAEPGGEGDDGSAVIQKMDLYKKLEWSRVAKQVQTRSWLHCKHKWMTYLKGKMKTGGKIQGRKSIEGQIQLIKAINEMAVEESSDIVWDDLTHLFGNTPPDYLQKRFYQLKVTYIPDWNRKSFCDIIDFLYEKTLPKLEEDLKGCKDDDDDEPAELRQSYKLSEIFPNL